MAWLGELKTLRHFRQLSSSILRPQLKANTPSVRLSRAVPSRCMSHGPRKMYVYPTAWHWHQMKNELHLYTWLGLGPFFLFWAYFNFFVGEAELAEIPEGYDPEDYEYWKHPMTRWLVKTFYMNRQELYEKKLAHLHEHGMYQLISRDVKLMNMLMKENHDFIGWSYRPITNKYADLVYEESGSLDAINKSKAGLMSSGAM